MKRPGKMDVHYARVAAYIKRNQAMVAEAKASGCTRCGEKHLATLDFHHRDPAAKGFGIAAALGRMSSEKRLKQEIDKCDILCANCHRKLHWEEKNASNS